MAEKKDLLEDLRSWEITSRGRFWRGTRLMSDACLEAADQIEQLTGRKHVPHTVEDNFQHFLSYSGKRGQNEDDLRLAYYAGAGLGY